MLLTQTNLAHWTTRRVGYGHTTDQPNMAIGGIAPAMKQKTAA
ncbi:hypothetical protein LP7551_04440 [Roseibium album]|nr:hypothetical protein LP7551_04440 [Roseibium album]